MFRRRPPVDRSTPPPPPTGLDNLDKAHGFLYWTNQRALTFGLDRREPRSHRPTLTLVRSLGHSTVLPSTSQPNPAFFHLPPDQCLFKRKNQACHSYLCPRYEIVPNQHMQEAGIVTQEVRVRVLQWLREREAQQ